MRGGGKRKCSGQKGQQVLSPEARGNTSCSRNQEVREAGPQSEEVSKRRSWGWTGCKRSEDIIPTEWGGSRWGDRAAVTELRMDRLTPTGASMADGQEEGGE